MILLPALDLRSGKCVRLLQGRDDAVTVYGEDPLTVAASWADQGASWLHIVNLDGAFGRASENVSIVEKIVSNVDVKVEFGGGLRSEVDVARALGAGVQKAVVGTLAFRDRPALRRLLRAHGTERIVVAIDAKEGIVATEGWRVSAGITVVAAAKELEQEGVTEVLYTDVGRDGMMVGPDMARLQGILEQTGLFVIASGGISSLSDLEDLKNLKNERLSGVVVGKALYEGKITLVQALHALK